MPYLFQSLPGEVYKVWTKALIKSSVAADMPRLGFKILAYDKHNIQVHPQNIPQTDSNLEASKNTNLIALRDLLRNLSRQLLPTETHETRVTAFFQGFVDGTQVIADLSRLSTEFLTHFGDNDVLVKLLKTTCNQGIVFPAWKNLKAILKDFPFRDVKRSWHIYVFFTLHEVIVIHRKMERGLHADTQIEEFSFTWELKLVYTSKLEELKSAVYGISEFHVKEMDLEKSKSLNKHYQSLANTHLFTFVCQQRFNAIIQRDGTVL